MRAGDLIGRPVRDTAGRDLGAIREIRTEVTPGADGLPQLVVRGVIVGRTRVRLFGYQRHDQRGPKPLVALIRRLHRHTRYVAWEDVDLSDRVVRVRRPFGELAPLERP
ncbi:hypothetical protein AMES_3241 [Amycolatopsis mediterranei S699]|uniref:PRC-barrel domain-containing protein n=2 Tax=Amycolatopsis mediterranei TaxID=33910 RepID=A0A0H3D4A8_AMYMU|nr:hypothetical protein [Amycolatopsis mediterranei]ADJ45066.1 hypothetical protein AMED_3277 [Amycolatopsis mediterranei U32]AEK41822.1 hypothetical protein RAM_16670 [Amycolatopsis mediterranei S699]AFO76777.1 hypothetical protein AMES_3241 [Amycolatopsis mediterranei S699]AGT83905.1 hypothetical protein B737_3241 [Amycolatopsis mediterranei RB]KDO08706.1 hypothetical protein DV26_21715 [Amycolatopsis mediterranei]